MHKFLIINQYGSTPNTGYGGRSYYLSQSLAKSRKITFVSGSYHHNLQKQDHQISHVDQNNGKPFFIKIIKLFKYSNSRSILRFINWFIFLFKLCLLNKKKIGFRPTCILYSSPALPGYIGAYFLAKKFSCPLYLEVRDIWPLSIVELGPYSNNNLAIILLNKIEKFAYKTANGVVSNLFNLKKHIRKYTNKKIKFHFSPNGVIKNNFLFNDNYQKSKPLNNTLKELKKIQKLGKTIIGYVGGLAAANAVDLLIECALISRNDNNLIFVVVGNGYEKKKLKDKCKSLKLTNIKFFPQVKKNYVTLILEKMDILFLANRFKKIYTYGVSPIKLPEYLLSKKPIVHVTNSNSLLDIFKCGEVVREYNPSAVLKSIYVLKNLSNSKKKKLGELVSKNVEKKMNYDIIGKSLLTFLEGSGA